MSPDTQWGTLLPEAEVTEGNKAKSRTVVKTADFAQNGGENLCAHLLVGAQNTSGGSHEELAEVLAGQGLVGGRFSVFTLLCFLSLNRVMRPIQKDELNLTTQGTQKHLQKRAS